jgi:hypothetical protein
MVWIETVVQKHARNLGSAELAGNNGLRAARLCLFIARLGWVLGLWLESALYITYSEVEHVCVLTVV